MTHNHFSENGPIQISDSELDELQDFLLSDAVPEGAMSLDTLDCAAERSAGSFFCILIRSSSGKQIVNRNATSMNASM